MNAPAKPPAPAFDAESLAIFLCLGGSMTPMRRRPQLLEAWEEKEDSIKEAYRRRARRLMRLWRTP